MAMAPIAPTRCCSLRRNITYSFCDSRPTALTSSSLSMLVSLHSVEVMVYQYDKLLGYGCWMTSIPTISHIFIFLGYSEFPRWLPWQPIQILQYPKSIQQNIKMWDMVGTLVIQQPHPKSLSY